MKKLTHASENHKAVIFVTENSIECKIYHERTHIGEIPYSCSIYDKKFIVKCNKEKNKKTHIVWKT